MLPISLSSLAEFAGTPDALGLFAFEDSGLASNAIAPGARQELLERAKQEGFSGKQGEAVSFLTKDRTAKTADQSKERRFFVVGLGKIGRASCRERV